MKTLGFEIWFGFFENVDKLKTPSDTFQPLIVDNGDNPEWQVKKIIKKFVESYESLLSQHVCVVLRILDSRISILIRKIFSMKYAEQNTYQNIPLAYDKFVRLIS